MGEDTLLFMNLKNSKGMRTAIVIGNITTVSATSWSIFIKSMKMKLIFDIVLLILNVKNL